MVLKSRFTCDIPLQSLPSWVFGSPSAPLEDLKQFIDPERPDTHFLTLEQYRLWSKRIALGFKDAGLKVGDRVLMFSGNNIFFPSIFMGVIMAGGMFTGANPSFTPRELAYQLKDSGASFLVASGKSLEVALEAAKQAGLDKSRIYLFDDTALDSTPGQGRLGVKHWTALLTPSRRAESWIWVEPRDPRDTICCLNYSSGTTGNPKGVAITHYNYIANGVQVHHLARLAEDYEERNARAVALLFLPLYHAYGQTYFTCNIPHLQGMPIYVMQSFDFIKMLTYVQKYRVSGLAAVPPIVVALAKHPATKKFDLSSIESIGCGAAPLADEVSDEALRNWPDGAVLVRQGWGMTEVTCTAMGWDPRTNAKSSAVGELMPNVEAKLVAVDGSGEITEAKQRGELWVSGPTVMKGYWNRPQETANTIEVDAAGKRWLKTGDVAYIDEYAPGGLWRIVDRIKELIKVKGNQVAPAELEGLLLENSEVTDACVVGVTIGGEELPRAYIVPSNDKVSGQDIAKWVESRVIHYKRLKGGVVLVDEIPKNPSGKILRKILRERAAKEVGDKKPPASKLA